MRPSILRRAVDRAINVACVLIMAACLLAVSIVFAAISRHWFDPHL
jgi:hypothetical protein